MQFIRNKNFWILYSMSYKHCEHIYTDRSKKCGQICGIKINLKFDGKNFKCSRHIGIKHTPKAKNLPNENRCNGTNKYGERCKKRIKENGLCIHHYDKNIIINLNNKINIKEKKNIFEKDKIKNIHNNVKEVSIKSLYEIVENFKKNINSNNINSNTYNDNNLIIKKNNKNNTENIGNKFLFNIDVNVKFNNILDNNQELDKMEKSYLEQNFEYICNYINNELNSYNTYECSDIFKNGEIVENVINSFYNYRLYDLFLKKNIKNNIQ